MTTIATDGKSMAGESLVSCNGYALGMTRKVCRASDGRIFGCSGDSVEIARFVTYMVDGGDKPEFRKEDGFCALVLNPDGTVDWMDRDFTPIRYLLPAAIGSGGEIAQGAMMAGATPAEAVSIAMRLDRKSGGEITVEHLAPALSAAA